MKQLIINIAVGWMKSAASLKIKSNEIVKDVVHAGNKKLAEKVKISGSGIDGVNYGKDLIDLGQLSKLSGQRHVPHMNGVERAAEDAYLGFGPWSVSHG